MIDSEKIKKALDAMDNADLQKEYNPIAIQKHMEMMLKTARLMFSRTQIHYLEGNSTRLMFTVL